MKMEFIRLMVSLPVVLLTSVFSFTARGKEEEISNDSLPNTPRIMAVSPPCPFLITLDEAGKPQASAMVLSAPG